MLPHLSLSAGVGVSLVANSSKQYRLWSEWLLSF